MQKTTRGCPFAAASILLALAALGSTVVDGPRAETGDSRGSGGEETPFTGQIEAVICVSDVEKSAPFYRDVLGFAFLGFAESKGQAYYAEMAAGTVKFGLHEPMSERQRPRVGRQRLYFRVVDLRALRERVVSRGAEAGELKEPGWMDMFVVRDPDGNEIFFALTDPTRHTSDPWSTQ